ncbi:hypothetical protein G6F55_005331 [Rhizopus delemar]|uniref:Uncharacterized protein n=2 Tax=Rhizopus TaxID=4842 RepID=A0A9P6Z154_9FUNG|nr:hypothetical protein G6F55_005331 [Rhizopus delemar]KAG1551974.1 hypothetical protein G6F51_001517 [Rhizopus arrhizus]KAG1519523.1 hypothetical protein G6F52_008539 [Rhizopus delemar]KAG1556914.1 hypothetical protein G6F49_005869 [Rhizopus delemar]KAG1568637.1 hypothetical protein G6F50_007106 [Rhizopus delemar]
MATNVVIVDQAAKNIPQFLHQAAMDSHHTGAPTGYNFCHGSLDILELPIQACIPSDQQHSTTMFNIDGALTQSSSYCVSGLVSVAFHSILFFDIDRKNLPENADSFSLL